MNLNTYHLHRCIEALESAQDLFIKAKPDGIEKDVFRNAILKGFELTQETTFKLMKKSLKDFGYSANKLDTTPIKEIIRLAATHGLIAIDEVDAWFSYRDNRNDTAHDYGEEFVKQTLSLLPSFIVHAKKLESELISRFGDPSLDQNESNAKT